MNNLLTLAQGRYQLDSQYFRTGCTACYLMKECDEIALFDCASNNSVSLILQALSSLNLAPQQVRYLFLSHVHLDHAGGAGLLIQHLPYAQVILQASGIKHMVDPSALVSGTTQVYGQAFMEEHYGTIHTIDSERMIACEDQQRFPLGQTTLQTLDTPGHAWHHISVVDESSGIVFAGDSMGICYDAQAAAGTLRSETVSETVFILPTTPPSQFNPEAMIESIRRQSALGVERFALSHFGTIPNHPLLIERLIERIEQSMHCALEAPEQQTERWITNALKKLFKQWLSPITPEDQLSQRLEEYQHDVFLCAKGLAYWVNKQRSA